MTTGRGGDGGGGGGGGTAAPPYGAEQLRAAEEVCFRHVEALVVLFSRISDIENVRFDYLLGHAGYDVDGNKHITADDLARLRTRLFLLCVF